MKKFILVLGLIGFGAVYNPANAQLKRIITDEKVREFVQQNEQLKAETSTKTIIVDSPSNNGQHAGCAEHGDKEKAHKGKGKKKGHKECSESKSGKCEKGKEKGCCEGNSGKCEHEGEMHKKEEKRSKTDERTDSKTNRKAKQTQPSTEILWMM